MRSMRNDDCAPQQLGTVGGTALAAATLANLALISFLFLLYILSSSSCDLLDLFRFVVVIHRCEHMGTTRAVLLCLSRVLGRSLEIQSFRFEWDEGQCSRGHILNVPMEDYDERDTLGLRFTNS